MSKNKPWKIPQWMKPFCRFINNTGGNDIEDLMNDHDTTVQVNAPRAMICVAVKSQAHLLQTLQENNLLKDTRRKAGTLISKDWFDLAVEALTNKLPSNHGFALFTFPFDGKGPFHYMSNSKRDDVIAMLKCWIAQAETKPERDKEK
jgi:hypothetical protein